MLALPLIAVSGAWAQGPWTSGDCTVTFNDATLTISGNGAMEEVMEDVPGWFSTLRSVDRVVVEEGVTTLCPYAFFGEKQGFVDSFTLPSTLTKIGMAAFAVQNDEAFTTITIPANVTEIGDNAFAMCSNLAVINCYANPAKLVCGDNIFTCEDFPQFHVPSNYYDQYVADFSDKMNVTFVGDLPAQGSSVTTGYKVELTALFEYEGEDTEEYEGSTVLPSLPIEKTMLDWFHIVNPEFVPDWSNVAVDDASGPSITVGEAQSWNTVVTVEAPGTYVVHAHWVGLEGDNITITAVVSELGQEPVPVTVTAGETANQWTLDMPEGNVELSVEYYPLATCTAPVAKEGILVGAADEIVTAGTPDGGKMYYLMTLANEKPESTEGFTEALPTAQSVTEEGQVYVWYYVDGDAEHSSSDIYADAVPVTLVAPAPGEAHTLTFAAANIFTIEGGKAAVKVNADAKTLNEDKELKVKAGATITIEAIPGYKIKSVNVKKGGAGGLKTPLTMEAITDGTIVVQYPQSGMQYSINGGEKNTFSNIYGDNTIEVNAGDKVAFYGNGTSITYYSPTKIHGGTADVKLYGNIMSLVDEENYATATSLENCKKNVFSFLFGSTSTETHLIDAGDLLLPATTLTNSCYSSMFQNCTNLTTVPELPATTLAPDCYIGMFYGCTSLTTLPEGMLPATELAGSCYNAMFRGCTSLTTAPVLPATTLASGCYSFMFEGCSSLTTAPELPATTLTISCYCGMFQNCTSLTTAPVLLAETLLSSSYARMFLGCSSLSSVTCLAINIPDYSTDDWLSGVAASGTFIKAASKNNWPRNVDGIPNGWTIQNYEP